MEIKEQTKLRFNGTEVISINFNAYNKFNQDVEIDFNIKPKVFYPKDVPSDFKIVFDVELKAEEFFDLNVVMVGSFQLESEIDEDRRKTFVNLNAPAIMFPYVRSLITTITANCGPAIVPIVMPPHFFKGNLDEIEPEGEDPINEQVFVDGKQ